MKNCFNSILCLLAMICMSCHDAARTLSKSLNQFKPPIIIDTLPSVVDFKISSSITLSYPKLVTVMPFGDSCILKESRYNPWDTSINRNVEQRSDGLQFLVDTTQIITIKNDKEETKWLGDTSQEYYKGFPCFVYNEGQQVKWLLVQDSRVIVVQEAMDSNYHWRPIQIWGWDWCGNAYYRIPIKPRHYLLFKSPLYKGDFYTEIRLKLHTRDVCYYSNTYKGWINYKQFNLTSSFSNKEGKLSTNYDFLSF